MSAVVQSLPNQAIVHAYRHLYRQGLKVIRYSTPGRHVLRSVLQTSFRSAPREEFDSSKIVNTLRFLERAATVTGFEHKIVKNLLLARYWARPHITNPARVLRGLGLSKAEIRFRKSAYEHYDTSLERLNESLGTCLK